MEYQHIAQTLATRTAELLQTTVAITDDRDRIIAASDARVIGQPVESVDDILATEYLRLPLRGDGGGEIIVAEPRAREDLSPRLARIIVDLVVNQTIDDRHLPDQHTKKNRFIHDLLHGAVSDETAILREAKSLGLDLVPPRAVILIDAAAFILGPEGGPSLQVDRRVHLLIGSIVSFFTLPNDTICAYLGEGEIAVLKASNTRNLVKWAGGNGEQEPGTSSWANLDALKRASSALLTRLRADTGAPITIGIGRHHPGLPGLARSYQDARAALSLGRCLHGTNQVHCLDNLGIAAFVGIDDEHTKTDLALHLLSPLDHEPELLETLDIFFAENCCPSSVAARLRIHRNTLGYRLDKITSLTGLNPRRFDEALQIRLALVLRALQRRHGGEENKPPAPERLGA